MPLIPGLPRIRTLNVPLTGRACVIAGLVDTDLVAFPITNSYKVRAEFMLNPDTAVILTKNSSAGEITVLSTAGYVYIPLTAPDILLFKGAGKVLTIRVTLIRVSDGVTVALSNHFYAIPINQLYSWSQPTEVAMALSTEFFNTVVSALGEAYLDNILCVNQAVGCTLRISVGIDSQPETWVLRASVVAALAGSTRRAVDYAAGTCEKVWFRE